MLSLYTEKSLSAGDFLKFVIPHFHLDFFQNTEQCYGIPMLGDI